MKIAVIGGGYTGLAATYYLSQKGVEVILFEKEKNLGGLAMSFKDKNWQWSLEKFYHHIFASDQEILELAERVNCPLIFTRPKTSIFYAGTKSPFDSAQDLLFFPHLPLTDRLRTGAMILFLKIVNNWRPLEKITAEKFIRRIAGELSWKIIWQPLFKAKFDQQAGKIPAAWFWARIKKRGNRFRYPKGGFANLTTAIVKAAKTKGAKFLLRREVKSIKLKKDKIIIKTDHEVIEDFDKVICTLPGNLFVKIAPRLPVAYAKKLTSLEGRAALVLVLGLKRKFLTDGTYWLNVNDETFPFIGVIEQTNYMPKKRYGNDHLIYLVKYLPINHPFFHADKQFLIKKFYPFLKKINPAFTQAWIKKSWLFKAAFAQPIMTLNYSQKIPAFVTPIKNIYLANMQQVYPWDRQTNYAVELGKKISEIVSKSS